MESALPEQQSNNKLFTVNNRYVLFTVIVLVVAVILLSFASVYLYVQNKNIKSTQVVNVVSNVEESPEKSSEVQSIQGTVSLIDKDSLVIKTSEGQATEINLQIPTDVKIMTFDDSKIASSASEDLPEGVTKPTYIQFAQTADISAIKTGDFVVIISYNENGKLNNQEIVINR